MDDRIQDRLELLLEGGERDALESGLRAALDAIRALSAERAELLKLTESFAARLEFIAGLHIDEANAIGLAKERAEEFHPLSDILQRVTVALSQGHFSDANHILEDAGSAYCKTSTGKIPKLADALSVARTRIRSRIEMEELAIQRDLIEEKPEDEPAN